MCIDGLTFQRKGRTLFDSQRIASAIAEEYMRDLESHFTAYVTPEPVIQCVKEASLDSLLKKFQRPKVNNLQLRNRAYDKFLGLVEDLREIPHLSACRRPTLRHTPEFNLALWRARSLIHQVLKDFDLDEWFASCKHSSGSSLGVPYVDTSLERKWEFPLTCTQRVKTLFHEYLRFDGQLRNALEESSGFRHWDGWYSVVQGSRAHTVPKNDEIDRMIAIEPTLNMFFQQGLMEMMYDRLAAFGLDVRALPGEHTWKAFMASITEAYATVDWSSASDCVLLWLVEELFPPKWFWAINLVRSPFMEINGDNIELPMVGTMGNATTFPIETLVFWALAEASTMTGNEVFRESEDLRYIREDKRRVYRQSVHLKCSVFGDDCVVPVESADKFIDICTQLGFRVNEDKTFSSGPFRESCGGDYHRGYDVRPLYIRGPVGEGQRAIEAWLYTITNGIIKKYISYFGPLTFLYNKRVFRLIFDLLQAIGSKVRFVPPGFADDAGIQTEIIDRWEANYDFQRYSLATNKHGSVMFSYLRFEYGARKSERNDHIRYVTAIKAATSFGGNRWFQKHKRRGRYVVSLTSVGHWPTGLTPS